MRPLRVGDEASVIRGDTSLDRDPPPLPPSAAGPAAGVFPDQVWGTPAASLSPSRMPTPEEVAALVRSGLSDAQLGRHFSRGDGWAYKFRRRHGIPAAQSRPAAAPDRDEIDAANRAYAVQLPSRLSEARAAALFRRRGWRYEDIPAAELRRERAREARRPAIRNVTAAVFGDPPRGPRRVPE